MERDKLRIEYMEEGDMVSFRWKIVDRWFPNYHSWERPKVAFFLLCFFLTTCAIPYFLTNRIAAWRGVSIFNPENFIDEIIPYMSWNVIFYFSFYLYFPIVSWYGSASGQRREEGLIFHQILTRATLLACLLFVIFPVKVNLRHQVVSQNDLFNPFVTALHTADPPFNSWPSLHVFQSFLIVMVMRRWLIHDGKWKRWLSPLVWVCWSLLVFSTMSTKQHYIFDAATGLIFAILVWFYACKPKLNQIVY